MIHTSKQLKDKVRNISKGNNNIAKALIRNFIMERFLERVSVSDYCHSFILKGGMLVASIIGVDMRATMDIDTTVKSLPVNADDAQRIITEICSIQLGDSVSFRITSVSDIMDDFEYPGVRMTLEAALERMRQVIKIDISTDDVITPSAVEYKYKLMFEDRTIPLLTYNVETLLAEKIQTILARGIANTRLRDFYDVYEIMKICASEVDKELFLKAFYATCKKRESVFSREEMSETLTMIKKDTVMKGMWEQFRKKNYFVGDLEWDDVLQGVLNVIYTYILKEDRIISALIGLVGACNNNPKTADTDDLVIRALAFPLICPEYDEKALQKMIDDIYSEKKSIAPGCAMCAAPCGNTSDYDMCRIYEADDAIRKVKLQILEKLQKLAAYACGNQQSGMISYIDSGFFYKALSYVSYDVGEAEMLGLLSEAEHIERDIKSGGMRNDQEDYQN